MRLNGDGDHLVVSGDLKLGSVVSIDAGKQSAIEVSGDFSHAHTDENMVSLDEANVLVNGGGSLQRLEVASLITDKIGWEFSNGNFGLGQLIVGTQSDFTNLVLVDLIDNGNRGISDALDTLQNELMESIYLIGIDGSNGLDVAEGSTLFLGESPNSIIATFAILGGEMIDVLSLWETFGISENRLDLDIVFGTTGVHGDLARVVPIPAALPLFVSALVGIGLFSRRRDGKYRRG